MNGQCVAACRECTIVCEVDLQEVADTESGEWKDYMAKRKGWTVSSTHLVTSDQIVNMTKWVGRKFELTVRTGTPGYTVELVGWAIMTTMKASGTIRGMLQGAFGWKGCGMLDTYDYRDKDTDS